MVIKSLITFILLFSIVNFEAKTVEVKEFSHVGKLDHLLGDHSCDK